MNVATQTKAAKASTAQRAVRRPCVTRLARCVTLLCLSALPALAQADAADLLLAMNDSLHAAAWAPSSAVVATTGTTATAATSTTSAATAAAAIPAAFGAMPITTNLAAVMAPGLALGPIAAAAEQTQFPAPGLARPAWAGAQSTTSSTRAAKPWQTARLVEVPREAPAPGQQQKYNRPRYALGFQSQSLKTLLANAGMDPHACLAPMIRLRTKVSQEGDVSGSFWLYARCSFR